MTDPLDFQSIIMTLQRFWAEQGCLIWQPYYTQVGAGTMNPATYLRVLGPEPWNVAYVEPSVRPDDGRYGENPNRLQQHYQFQVILKPDPGNPQELYLQSLAALGIDPRRHDIRFVEDNWESPALGAWGLGWEVWLDGQEITQFTYFQQAGGMVVDPVAVEITYGLERISMPLQRVRNFRDIHWSPSRTYGDVNLQGEQEHSKYYFELADVDRLRQLYSLFEAEANASLAAGLVLPAHDYVLKCSQTFNILDTRGAVGITERQALFARMRDLSRRVAEAYAEQRETLGHPWLSAAPVKIVEKAAQPAVKTYSDPQTFLFEIGTEELPAADLDSALDQLRQRLPALLDDLRLEHGAVQVLGTPRRLVAIVEKVSPHQPNREVVVKGPPAARAFTPDGKPTPAAEGFAKGKGISASALQAREIDGGQYVVAVIQETGRPAVDVLADALPGLVASIKFDKTMRWNSTQIAFSRPIRWLMALFGQSVVPFSYAGLESSNVTRGLRFHEPEEFPVANAPEYLKAMEAQGIQLDVTGRRAVIAAQVEKLSRQAGGDGSVDQGLLDEVVQLVESPICLLGKFDPAFLRLPPEVLISVMKKHQRYFPIQKADGSLLPSFIVVRNGDDQHLDVVADGNEQVITARFADADFFIRDDIKHKLEEFLPRLSTLTFQVKLGSMLDKTHRIEKLTGELCARLNLTSEESKTALRAAALCKADLASHMVVEMTSLQGIMGRHYARLSGETEEVAQAIYEHYLPRFAGDIDPKSKAGLAVGLADRLDSLSGLFAAGLAPTGTKDPFAQRRAALSLVQALINLDIDFNLEAGLQAAAVFLPISASPEVLRTCLEFITGRLQSGLLDQGLRYDAVAAVLAEQGANPARAARSVKELTTWVARPDWAATLAAYSRCVRITRDQKERFTVQESALTDPAEKELWSKVQDMEKTNRRPGSVDDLFTTFLPAIPAINTFFEKVMVMADDAAVRSSRLGLLQHIAALAKGVADLSLLEGF
jgi:glycyl-tRNA synthetase